MLGLNFYLMNQCERGHPGWRGAGDSHFWPPALSHSGMLLLSSWSPRAPHHVPGPTSGQQKEEEGRGKEVPLPFQCTSLLLIRDGLNLVTWPHLIMKEVGKCLYSGCLWAQLKCGASDTTRTRITTSSLCPPRSEEEQELSIGERKGKTEMARRKS